MVHILLWARVFLHFFLPLILNEYICLSFVNNHIETKELCKFGNFILSSQKRNFHQKTKDVILMVQRCIIIVYITHKAGQTLSILRTDIDLLLLARWTNSHDRAIWHRNRWCSKVVIKWSQNAEKGVECSASIRFFVIRGTSKHPTAS